MIVSCRYFLLGYHDFRAGGGVTAPSAPPPASSTSTSTSTSSDGGGGSVKASDSTGHSGTAAAAATADGSGGPPLPPAAGDGKSEREMTEKEKERTKFTLLGGCVVSEQDEYTVAQQYRDQIAAQEAAAKAVKEEASGWVCGQVRVRACVLACVRRVTG
jgi:hypothetical protein